MQITKIYTFTFNGFSTFTLNYTLNSWGWFDAFQVQPSYNQGFNSGVATVSEVHATMSVSDPGGPVPPSLTYNIVVKGASGEATMCDIYHAAQQA